MDGTWREGEGIKGKSGKRRRMNVNVARLGTDMGRWRDAHVMKSVQDHPIGCRTGNGGNNIQPKLKIPCEIPGSGARFWDFPIVLLIRRTSASAKKRLH